MAHYGSSNNLYSPYAAIEQEALAWAFSSGAQPTRHTFSTVPLQLFSTQQTQYPGPIQIAIEAADQTHTQAGDANLDQERMATTGACERCKKLKAKCEYTKNEASCRRCSRSGYDCAPRKRKERERRVPLSEHETVVNFGA